jgi:DnaJ-class molecular chaperone
MEELYNILEISENSSEEEIKKQYRKLAFKYHPDKNNGDDEKFKKIQNAYEILTDDEKKREYLNNSDISINLNDLFAQMFSIQKNTIVLKLSLYDILNGNTKEFITYTKSPCLFCNETGIKDYHKNAIECRECFGKGVNPSIPFLSCMSCQGQGIFVLNKIKCDNCKGKGYNKIKNERQINIPMNIKNNTQIELDDVILICQYDIKEKNVKIIDDLLYMNIQITLDDLLCGFVKEINLCDKIYYIQSEHVFDINKKYKLFDNFFIEFNLNINNFGFYKKLSQHLRSLFRKTLEFKKHTKYVINIKDQ